MNILALETSTEACSVALLRDDGEVFAEFDVVPRQHTVFLPKMMDAVLAAGQCSKLAIDFCAFTNGPGAFTGVRIAASMAQGIAIALKIPLVPISTLATLAQLSLDQQLGRSVMVALDARMGEVYWALYRRSDAGFAVLCGEEKLNKLEEIDLETVPDSAAGHGWLAGAPLWEPESEWSQVPINAALLPDAESLLKLAKQAVIQGQVVRADALHINYLRSRIAARKQI